MGGVNPYIPVYTLPTPPCHSRLERPVTDARPALTAHRLRVFSAQTIRTRCPRTLARPPGPPAPTCTHLPPRITRGHWRQLSPGPAGSWYPRAARRRKSRTLDLTVLTWCPPRREDQCASLRTAALCTGTGPRSATAATGPDPSADPITCSVRHGETDLPSHHAFSQAGRKPYDDTENGQ